MMWSVLQVCALALTLKVGCHAEKITDHLECHEKVADVVFVLDSSVSLWEKDFAAQLDFVQMLVDTFAVGPKNIRVGIMTFGTDVRLDFNLKEHQTKKELKTAIGEIAYLGERQGTNTGEALQYARSKMFEKENGGRDFAGKVIILITDGYSHNLTKTLWEASMAHSDGIEVFAIGVGLGKDDRELRGIGSTPKDKHVFRVDNYNALPNIQEALEHMSCDRPSNNQSKTEPSVKPDTGCGGKPADVYFIVDSSSSIWRPDFDKQLDFIKEVIGQFDLGQGSTRVGVITFSDGIHPIIPLTGSQNRRDLEEQIDKVPYTGGGTNTGGAIRFLTDHAFAADIARPEVAHVAILMTDGQSKNLTNTYMESQRAHKAGIYLFAIGIGQFVDTLELNDIASNPDDDFVFQVDDYTALTSIKDLLAIKACQVHDNFMKDQPASCSFDTATDVMFVFDSGAIGRRHSHMIEDLIGDVVREMELKHHVTRAGIIRESCSQTTDIGLSQYNNAHAFKRHLKNVEYKGLQPLIQKLRRYSFKPRYGGRKSSQKIAVIFVDDLLDNPGPTILEARRAKFTNIRVIVVATGNHYDEKQLEQLVTSPASRNVVHVDHYKNIAEAKGRLLYSMCAGR
ncbi:cartilage matrix protein-like isoform X1 [Haliotis rufescens]|uniref:cartilage matrix protein-like isoform X1 n=1 Tax=Haliotis rufescens TaxID=6454 RepID=UPI00201EEA05|nr:cartilage matrix protein-like isoform X1 [Haliotis rufescens]